MPRPKPAQNVNAARLAFQSFSVTSPMCTGCGARNSVRCEEVVSLLFDKFSLAVSIFGTLKLHKLRLVQCYFSSWLKGLNGSKMPLHSIKLASFITLTPSFRQFPFTIRLYDDATQGSKSVSDSGTWVYLMHEFIALQTRERWRHNVA